MHGWNHVRILKDTYYICKFLTYPKNRKKIYDLEKKLWSFIYQNVGFVKNSLSVADISQRYQSGNYHLQLTEMWLLYK